MFTSKAMIFQALLAGEKVTHVKNDTPMMMDFYICLDQNGDLVTNDGKEAHPNFSHPELWKIYSKKQWFERMPVYGVFCQVHNSETPLYAVITGVSEDGRFIDKDGNLWESATPVESKKLKKFTRISSDLGF